MKKIVSIIIPTYNGEKYIKETIDSCLAQTYQDVEIIVIDDCSNDDTIKLLKGYGDKIKLHLNETNQGISKNVNKGVDLSTGHYFILLGHDDILSDVHIEIMLQEFDNDTVAVHCNSVLIDSEGKEMQLSRDDNKQFKKTDNCLFELSLDNFISSCGMMHRKKVFDNMNGWDESYKFYGEWLYYIKSLEYGNIKYTDKTFAYYRIHDTNISKTLHNKDKLKAYYLYKKRCRLLSHKYSKNLTMSKYINFNFQYFLNYLRYLKAIFKSS